MRRVRARVAGACLLLLTTACAGPSRTRHDYELKAANTAEAVVSAIGTAQVGVQAAREDRASGPFLSVLLREAADDATAAQATFDSRQPPDSASDDLRDELDKLIDDAVSTLVELRTAVRRGEVGELAKIGEPLQGQHDKLDTFEQAHS
jgi:hypothetical protein